MSIPQAADPVVIRGHHYLLETDEFANFTLGPDLVVSGGYEADAPVGAARLIDIEHPNNPFVVSNLRLEVHQKAAREGPEKNDPGASLPVQGYTGHYCSTPRTPEPGHRRVQHDRQRRCGSSTSATRCTPGRSPTSTSRSSPGRSPDREGGYAMSAPAYDLKHRMVWYSDGNSGFYAVAPGQAGRPPALLGARLGPLTTRRHLGPDAEQPDGALVVEPPSSARPRRR